MYGELGKGAYGLVRMGINKKTGEKVAVKLYHKKHLDEMNRLKNLEREINILAELDHPVIAKLIEAIETPTDIYLVMEYGGANSLYNYLLSKQEHRLKECEARKFFHTIAQTISYLHHKNIVHRDIKAENILINRYKDLKLIDFGFSIHSVPPSTIDTFCGTPTYMAP
jgi:MAP/microtubule affinity-regulating kinase